MSFMSLFGYPATVTHFTANMDSWGRVTSYTPQQKNAKVVEEQKEIKNAQGEDIQSIAEIHLEGAQSIKGQDYFEYVNGLGQNLRYEVRHIEIKKEMGTDDIKKVIVYG
jgi:hypothetical protein